MKMFRHSLFLFSSFLFLNGCLFFDSSPTIDIKATNNKTTNNNPTNNTPTNNTPTNNNPTNNNTQPGCLDGVKNGEETAVDCGGGCGLCNFEICTQNGQCKSGTCAEDVCVAHHCTNQKTDEGESDVDCGGNGCLGCSLYADCKTGADCGSGECIELKREEDTAPRLQCMPHSCEDRFLSEKKTEYITDKDVHLWANGNSYTARCFEDGYTLLLRAEKDSKEWGVDGIYWTEMQTETKGKPEDEDDYRGLAFEKMETYEIRICFKGTTKCASILHDKEQPLSAFYTKGDTYTAFASGMDKFKAVEEIEENDFLKNLGFEYTSETKFQKQCTWIGINYQADGTLARLGLLGDSEQTTCDSNEPKLDDFGFGIGLKFTTNAEAYQFLAGASRYLHPDGDENDKGTHIANVGPWYVLGK